MLTLGFSMFFFVFAVPDGPVPEPILRGSAETELAPHGEGNAYAPDVHIEGGRHRMWYGGQGRDGHDRIHLAESDDGRAWARRGVVFEGGRANHINDPSVVRVGGTYYLYVTRAEVGVIDEIALATSTDGIRWEDRGVVLGPGHPGDWDGLLVGRPSVLHDGKVFRMWYDGRKDLPPGPLAGDAPASPSSRRFVGVATSEDGIRWTRHGDRPVFGRGAGAVDVKKVGDRYVMVYESREGTNAAVSPDGLSWRDLGLWIPRSGGPIDAYGHVTPMLLLGDDGRPEALYVGAAPAPSWDRNAIAVVRLGPEQLRSLLDEGGP